MPAFQTAAAPGSDPFPSADLRDGGSQRPFAVLDTNVWLDWLVFDDPATRRLHGMVGRDIELCATPAMRAELADVLARRRLGLDERTPDRVLARFDAHVQMRATHATVSRPRLICRDPDDQKFLDLALESNVRWLLSRDKALLKLARRALAHGLTITTPAGWSMQARP